MKILIFEEFVKEPKAILREVLEFLGIFSEPPKVTGKRYNMYGESRNLVFHKMRNSKAVRKIVNFLPDSVVIKLRDKIVLKKQSKPKISKEVRHTLENFYVEDVKKLEKLLIRKLPWSWINDTLERNETKNNTE